MRWSARRPGPHVRPFLVLPLLDTERSSSADPTPSGTSPSTWPQHKPDKPCDIQRPLTATLERPELLNIHLQDTLDMSLVRKEFLCITNLCKGTVGVGAVAKGRRFGYAGPRHAPTPAPVNSLHAKRTRKPETSEDSLESDENSSVRRSRRKVIKVNALTGKTVKGAKKDRNDANNNTDSISQVKPPPNRSLPRSKHTSIIPPKPVEASLTPRPPLRSSLPLPEPCKTCGRPDAPERFHSHPATPLLRPTRAPAAAAPAAKSSVQKPVAIKYKSALKTAAVAEKKEDEKMRRPRTVTCYLCGREFGTKSLPLHEPKCLEKWERENSNLPRHLQRKPPPRPEQPMSSEEWNKSAWEAAQASLVPCEHCGRTFLPDRLLVHQRSCKPRAHPRAPVAPSLPVQQERGGGGGMQEMPTSPPGTVACYICGRVFGSRSIAIHEPQCLRKWRASNARLPPAQRQPEPTKDTAPDTAPGAVAAAAPVVVPMTPSASSRPPSGPRKPMLPCYICGREYGTSSIYIHEPQCLRKWRAENERLPPAQRRPEPARPDIKFTPSGGVDYIGTFHRIWENHLAELVACRICGRKFFPDRIEKHEKACNNLPIKLKKRK